MNGRAKEVEKKDIDAQRVFNEAVRYTLKIRGGHRPKLTSVEQELLKVKILFYIIIIIMFCKLKN